MSKAYYLFIMISIFSILSLYYSLKFLKEASEELKEYDKKSKEKIEELKSIYNNGNTFSVANEFDKIIKNFIEKSGESLDYTENRNLQKLCIDLYTLREMLSVDRKNKVAFDFINTLNEVERTAFYKLTSKFKEEIDEYRDNCLKNDFEKIKNYNKNI